MTRRLPASTMTMDLLVTAFGLNEVFAVFSDQAPTGRNSAISGERRRGVVGRERSQT